MKIRIRGNSLRYRLSRSEVRAFAETGSYQETTSFGNSIFTYNLKTKKENNGLSASYEHNTITLWMPEAEAREWTGSDRIGFENNMALDDGTSLFILLEKDFQCLDHSREDQSDMYINPNKHC